MTINNGMWWIREGFAHGFLVTSNTAEVLYKTIDYWVPEFRRSIIWYDPRINTHWPSGNMPTLSAKDINSKILGQAELFL